jgi:cellular nucleic acid-binding protein
MSKKQVHGNFTMADEMGLENSSDSEVEVDDGGNGHDGGKDSDHELGDIAEDDTATSNATTTTSGSNSNTSSRTMGEISSSSSSSSSNSSSSINDNSKVESSSSSGSSKSTSIFGEDGLGIEDDDDELSDGPTYSADGEIENEFVEDREGDHGGVHNFMDALGDAGIDGAGQDGESDGSDGSETLEQSIQFLKELERAEQEQNQENKADGNKTQTPKRRMSRYFDDVTQGVKCYNCGQKGHIAAACTSQSTKPCFLCGTVGHLESKCPHEVCFRCGGSGHVSRECENPRLHRVDPCLRCGGRDHALLACKYKATDRELARVRCYVCGQFGHLCCVQVTPLPHDHKSVPFRMS